MTCSNEGAAKASRAADDAAYALQLEADLGQKRVQEADVDAALADENDDEGAEVRVEHCAAAEV